MRDLEDIMIINLMKEIKNSMVEEMNLYIIIIVEKEKIGKKKKNILIIETKKIYKINNFY